jgi:putative nucleotidyltransferase with HDIG domain
VSTNALQLMGNPRSSMKDIGNIIGSDQAITSKLLRMVNSAYYGFPRKISTISQSLVVIGVEGLRSLIMGMSVQTMFDTKVGKALWAHSIATAASAKIVTQKYGNVHPEESFVVGLIHDIGRLLLSQHFPEEFEYYNMISMDSLHTLAKERELFGMDHEEIGASVVGKWNLPQKIVEAINYHHKPNLVPQNQVCIIICLAESIAKYIEDNKTNKEILLEDYINPDILEKLKIKEIPEQMIEDIKGKISELNEIFGKI